MGITAGSVFATTELRLLMLDVVTAALQAWPCVTITMYVDHITLEAMQRSRVLMQRAVTGATDLVVRLLEEDLELELSAKKSVVVASVPSLAAQIAKMTH